MEVNIEHRPVLANQVLSFIKPEYRYILDATCGGGGHTRAILERFPLVKVVCVDIDAHMIEIARKNIKSENVEFFVMNFVDVYKLGRGFDFILLDLGFSSIQLELPQYGLSFNKDFPLTMSYERKPLLKEFLDRAKPVELSEVFEKYGDIKNSYKVAAALISNYKAGKINSTKDIADLISSMTNRRTRLHPATKYFMALRMFLNNEIGNIKLFIDRLKTILNASGRCAVITFNSTEARAVKEAVRKNGFKFITKHAIKPQRQEVILNPRSRSARMRVFG